MIFVHAAAVMYHKEIVTDRAIEDPEINQVGRRPANGSALEI